METIGTASGNQRLSICKSRCNWVSNQRFVDLFILYKTSGNIFKYLAMGRHIRNIEWLFTSNTLQIFSRTQNQGIFFSSPKGVGTIQFSWVVSFIIVVLVVLLLGQGKGEVLVHLSSKLSTTRCWVLIFSGNRKRLVVPSQQRVQSSTVGCLILIGWSTRQKKEAKKRIIAHFVRSLFYPSLTRPILW